MTNRRGWIGSLALLVGLNYASVAQATAIDVLWYTYADPSSEYRQKMSLLSGVVQTLPQRRAWTWNLTYFDPSSAPPNFAAFDVLVIESGEAFRTGPPGGPLATPNYNGILNNKAAIEAARGDRTFITAADADFHAIRGDTGNIPDARGGRCDPPITSGECWDGALGHLVNAVNWAGNGNGLGIVSLLDGEFAGSFWWTHADSFLRSELLGYVDYDGSDNDPIIDPLAATFALNFGLTSAGLSDWGNSFHARFLDSVPGYTQIVGSGADPGSAVAIASSAFASAKWMSTRSSLTPTAPIAVVQAPSTLILFTLALALAFAQPRQRRLISPSPPRMWDHVGSTHRGDDR
ncbi:MAG TPA: hypothetical protein VML54_02900 [Candidatus Limnocylindrales bacterium]|nr:hypothetical protein [Candidatus Limnocylindrales bacterium]